MITDLFLRKVERLPDDIVKYIHEFLHIEIRIQMLTYLMIPEPIIQTKILSDSYYTIFSPDNIYYTSKIIVKKELFSVLDILRNIRFCDLKQFYKKFYRITDPKNLLQNTNIFMKGGDGMIHSAYHPISQLLLRADIGHYSFNHEYIATLISRRQYPKHYLKTSVKDTLTFDMRVKAKQLRKLTSNQYEIHFIIIKELYLLLLLFVRNFQNIESFISEVDYKLRTTLYTFLEEFLNSTLVEKAICRIKFTKCMSELLMYCMYLKRKRILKIKQNMKQEKQRHKKEEQRLKRETKEIQRNKHHKLKLENSTLQYVKKLFS